MICSRCLDLIDVTSANFCSRCGRNLVAIRSKTLEPAELHELEARLGELLSRLAEIRRWLDQCHREARQHEHAAEIDLVEKRLVLVTRLEQRLNTRLLAARRNAARP